MYALERASAQLKQKLQQAVEELTGGPVAEPVTLEVPPRAELGDLSSPVAMKLARALRRPPLVLAQELAGG